MKVSTFLSAAALAAAVITAPAANAATRVMVAAVGSSAEWQTAAIGAWNQLAGGPAGGAQWFTIKGNCTGSNGCVAFVDSRNAGIVPQSGSAWIVWNKAQTEVWEYLSVDSIVGDRAFFATPRPTLALDPMLDASPCMLNTANENLIVSALFQGQAQATCIPTAIYNALNGAKITAIFTDIRPEDAYFGNCRVLQPLDQVAYTGLGYGTGCSTPAGTEILSSFTSNFAQPVAFAVKGTDPISGATITSYTTFQVGAGAMVEVVNRTNTNGLGSGLTESGGLVTGGSPNITDIELTALQSLYNGKECDLALYGVAGLANGPVNVIIREPMSGTMNTHEFTNIRCGGPKPGTAPGDSGPCIDGTVIGGSQETGINPSVENAMCPAVNANGPANPGAGILCNNPLNLQCSSPAGGPAGYRYRGIGTGEEVGNGVLHVTDSEGYTFFSYGNVSKLTNAAMNAPYGYLTLNGVDPINAAYTNGALPWCSSIQGGQTVNGVCPNETGNTFPHIRDGSYRSWSLLRAVTDGKQVNKANYTNTANLVTAIQNNINTTVPDFVPAIKVGQDPGMTLYRSHFTQVEQLTGGTNNGLCGAKENGGDVGGYIVPVPTCPAPAVTKACPPSLPANSQNCHE